MQAGPRDGPGSNTFSQALDSRSGCFMKRRILAVCVNEDVCVDGNQRLRDSAFSS